MTDGECGNALQSPLLFEKIKIQFGIQLESLKCKYNKAH